MTSSLLTWCTCARCSQVEENMHACACTSLLHGNISTKDTINATTKTFRFHNSSRKTSKVMTSIASLHLWPLCAKSSDIISPLLSLWFYCERLQIHLRDNMYIQSPQPFGLYFTPTAPERHRFQYFSLWTLNTVKWTLCMCEMVREVMQPSPVVVLRYNIQVAKTIY